MEYYSATEKEQNNSIAATWIKLKILILSEVSQKEKDKYHMISLICGIWNMAQMNLCPKYKQMHRPGEQTCGCWGGGE